MGAITKNAERRLEAIQNLEELGSGFYLSMHDLEIRGAGEVLGDEQSGEMAQVGFELYSQMLKQAVEVVIDAGQASTSLLQRRCKLGYARAARIMDQMEQEKIIGPYEGAKPRAVLISRQQWLEMQMNQPEE